MYDYLFYFLFGGIVITTLYHFSKMKNTLICSIIPGIPMLVIIGFILTYLYNNDNITNYSKNLFNILIICLIFVGLFIYLYKRSKNFIKSIILSFVCWAILIFLYVTRFKIE